ncbi:hypothetical protein BJ742DRAFT_391723 [Cladochytrium replicatum]|nr:hypothetical protein BJ742DRAFT_391723 [Cladochytrium replicatum]
MQLFAERIIPTLRIHSLLASTSHCSSDVATAILNAVLLGMPNDNIAILLTHYHADSDNTDYPLLLKHAVERCNIPLIRLALSMTPSESISGMSHFHRAILTACELNQIDCFNFLASNPPSPAWSTFNNAVVDGGVWIPNFVRRNGSVIFSTRSSAEGVLVDETRSHTSVLREGSSASH